MIDLSKNIHLLILYFFCFLPGVDTDPAKAITYDFLFNLYTSRLLWTK